MPLSMAEVESGWVEWVCAFADHGFSRGDVSVGAGECGCGRQARPERNGVVLRKRDIKALQNQG